MDNQLTIFDAGAIDETAKPDWSKKFREWERTQHGQRAMAAFEKYALIAAETGRPFGIDLVRGKVRWEVYLGWRETKEDFGSTGEQYKINNNYSPYIARRLIQRHPHLAQFIRCRKAKGTINDKQKGTNSDN